jgi:hypothetical protein
MSPGQMGSGLVIDLISGLIVVWMMCMAISRLQCYGRRVLFVLLIGIFLAMQRDFMYLIWMKVPFDYTMAMLLDSVLG